MKPGERASIYVRPGAIRISDMPSQDGGNVWRAKFLGQMFHGEYTVVTVEMGGTRFKVRSDRVLKSPPEFLDVQVDSSDIVAFRDSDG